MTPNGRFLRLISISLCLFAALSLTAFAEGDRDRTQLGRNISIAPGEEVGEATCFGCTIRVRGHVSGDVTSFGGSILIEDQGQIDGDVTTFGGDIRLDGSVNVGGDVAVFGGHLRRDASATIGGDVTNMGGPAWLPLIFLTPLLFIGLFVAAIVWLIRRLLRPSVPVVGTPRPV